MYLFYTVIEFVCLILLFGTAICAGVLSEIGAETYPFLHGVSIAAYVAAGFFAFLFLIELILFFKRCRRRSRPPTVLLVKKNYKLIAPKTPQKRNVTAVSKPVLKKPAKVGKTVTKSKITTQIKGAKGNKKQRKSA